MNKNILRYCLYFLVVLAFIALIFSIVSKKLNKKELQSTFPSTHFYQLDSSLLVNSSITTEKIVLIYFNSGCEHCQYEAKSIAENLTLFKNSTVLWFSSENITQIKDFANKYQLANQNQIIFLKANAQDLSKDFGSLSPPSVWIYDKDRSLIKFFKGETKIEAITKYGSGKKCMII